MNIIPQDLIAEQSVIGSLMLDSTSTRAQKALATLKAESFYTKAHQDIYATITSLINKNNPVDLITVSDALESKGILTEIGGLAYLAELAKNTPTMVNIVAYSQVVRDKAIERYTLKKLSDCSAMLFERNGLTTSEKLSAIQSIFTQVDDYNKSGRTLGLKTLQTISEKWHQTLDDRISNPEKSIGLSTGIAALDKALSPKGIVRGSLFVAGARPKMGKTTFLINMARSCAKNDNLPALIFSLEMQDEQILENILAQESKISTDIFYDRGLGGSQFERVLHNLTELENTNNILIDDSPSITLSHIQSESRRINKERGQVGMIMVDYLTLMGKEKNTEDQRNDLAYGLITKGLKALAKELNCVVVLLTQLNRNLESRGDKRPMPSDSRDTGQIEQDCDYWIGLYRDHVYNEQSDPNVMEISLELNRHGAGKKRIFAGIKNGSIYDIDQKEGQAAYKQDKPKERKYAQN